MTHPHPRCPQVEVSLLDEYTNQWEEIRFVKQFSELDPIFQHYNTLHHSYIYCFPANITIEGKSHFCPPNVFRMSIDVSYKTGKLVHDATSQIIKVKGSELVMDRVDIDLTQESKHNVEQRAIIRNSMELKTLNEAMLNKRVTILQLLYPIMSITGLFIFGLLITVAYQELKGWLSNRNKQIEPKETETAEIELTDVKSRRQEDQ